MPKRMVKKRTEGKKIKGKSEWIEIFDIIIRYPGTLLFSFFCFGLFYALFTPLTLYPSAYILGIFYDVLIMNNFIFIKEVTINISNACVAGSAYYLLFMLNLITRGIKFSKRVLVFLFTSSLLLILNVARIVLLGIMRVNEIQFFDMLHFIFWHFVSIVYVFIVWIIAVKTFKIKEIPGYSDILYLIGLINSSKPKKANYTKRR